MSHVSHPVGPVTIIIPMHNAFSQVQSCVESVLRHTHVLDFRILLIDDASTDNSLLAYLSSLQQQHPDRIVVLTLDRNVGFVKAVNHGFAHTRGSDVVLLNSDTIVFDGWLSRLAYTAYAHPDTGSVTPVSNEASMYSVVRTQVPQLKKYGLLEKFAHLLSLEKTDTALVIPTAVGFCMYIPWKARKAVGVFNEAFGRGYGEENDWCMRAVSAGFTHYLDRGTFVYHEGGASMILTGDITSKTHRTVAAHEALLERMHPHYRQTIQDFMESNTALETTTVRASSIAQTLLQPHQISVAHILHNGLQNPNIGGTEIHVRDLVFNTPEVHHYILYPKETGILAVLHMQEQNYIETEYISTGQSFTGEYLQEQNAFMDFLQEKNIHIVHIHQLMGSTFSLIAAAKKCGVRVVYSLHDYYALGSPQLLDAHGEYSGIPPGENMCPADPSTTYDEWRSRVAPLLQLVDIFISPSQSALDLFAKAYPFVHHSSVVQEHGTYDIAQHLRIKNHHKNRVCFLGYTHAKHKGQALIAAIIPLLLEKGIDIYFLGTSSAQWPEISEHPRIHFLGSYTQKELYPLLHCIAPSVVCLFPNWPETYNYTVTECWRIGIPVCASPFGAIKERITQRGGGVLLEDHNPDAVVDTIMRTMQEPMHSSLCKQIDAMDIPTVHNVSQWYLSLYHNLAHPDSHTVEQHTATPRLPNFLIIGAQKCGSTWLWKHLGSHPDIFMAQDSECEFFSVNHAEHSPDISGYCQKYFSKHRNESALGEKTASYFWTSKNHSEWNTQKRPAFSTAEQAYRILGSDTKIILTLRHPVVRALSAYCHHLHYGTIEHTGDFIETAKQHGIIHMGFYAAHLEEWLRWFPCENIHIILQEEDVVHAPQETLRSVQRFLEVQNPDIIPDDISVVYKGIKRVHDGNTVYAHMHKDSATGKKIIPIATTEQLQQLYDLYLPDIQALEKLINRPVTTLWTKEPLQDASLTCQHTPAPSDPLHPPTQKNHHARKPFVYTIFSCLKDLWIDFGEPFPHLAHTIRHTILSKRWPVNGGSVKGNGYAFPVYHAQYVLTKAQHNRSMTRIESMHCMPGIHIILRIQCIDEIQLRKCLNAIVDQTYNEWTVTITDISTSTVRTVTQNIIADYSAHFPDKFFYSTPEEKSAVDIRTTAILGSTTPYVALLRMEDVLLPHALEYMISTALNQAELPDMVYSDHDYCLHRNDPEYQPVYKPQWSPELLLSHDYIASCFLLKTDVAKRILPTIIFQSDAYIYRILLQLTHKTYHIIHVPHILSHVHGDVLSDPFYEQEALYALQKCLFEKERHCAVVRPEASIESQKLFFQITYTCPEVYTPKVSILIPTKDRLDLLKPCLESIRAKTLYPNYEIVIMDNGSAEPEMLEYLRSIPEIVFRIETPQFNFAYINNVAVSRTFGELILLLNNDTEPVDPLWLTTMVATMQLDPLIGVVGARLLYPPVDGNYTVQSNGMIIGRNWASLAQFHTKEELGYFYCNYAMRNCSAIGGACLLTRRKLYNDVGGLDEQKFGVDFGDVDYCLKVQQEGYRVVCNPLASCIHHESATRGNNGGLGAHVHREEIIAFERKWGHMFGHDPYYNPHFSLSIHHEAFTVQGLPQSPLP